MKCTIAQRALQVLAQKGVLNLRRTCEQCREHNASRKCLVARKRISTEGIQYIYQQRLILVECAILRVACASRCHVWVLCHRLAKPTTQCRQLLCSMNQLSIVILTRYSKQSLPLDLLTFALHQPASLFAPGPAQPPIDTRHKSGRANAPPDGKCSHQAALAMAPRCPGAQDPVQASRGPWDHCR